MYLAVVASPLSQSMVVHTAVVRRHDAPSGSSGHSEASSGRRHSVLVALLSGGYWVAFKGEPSLRVQASFRARRTQHTQRARLTRKNTLSAPSELLLSLLLLLLQPLFGTSL